MIRFKFTKFCTHFLSLFLVIAANYSNGYAQKLLDPSGPLSCVTASIGGNNTSIAVAYSIRQLKTVYDHSAITPPAPVSGFTNSTSPLIRVKRSSDNGLLDIGYDGNGNLDTVVLKNFVSNNGANPTANGLVTIWYDQSGNSRDASKGSSILCPGQAVEPFIVSAGIIERNSGGQIGIAGKNGGMLGDGGTDFDAASSGFNRYGIVDDRTLNVVSQPRIYANGSAAAGDGTYLVDRNGGIGIQDPPLTSIKAVGGNWALQIRNESGDISKSFAGSVAISTNRSDNVTITRLGDLYTMYVDGTLAGSNTLVGNNSFSPVRVGYGCPYGEDVYYGELILFPIALNADDLSTINISQDDYYVIGPPPYTWTGATSTSWTTASNWTNATVPDALAAVTIPSGTPFQPTISSSVTIKKIKINSGATLTNNNTLNISDSLTVDGTLSGSGTVVMNGGVNQVISGATAPIIFNNLTISNTVFNVITNNNINVNGTLTVNANATFAPVATAVINNSGATGTITGSGNILVTRVTATPDYQSQYKFSTNTLTNLTTNYAGLGNQTINLGLNYGNLSISGSGVKTLSAAVTISKVTGNITVLAAELNNGGFAIAGNGSKTFLVANGGTFKLSASTYPTGFGSFTFEPNSTVEYASSGSQTIAAANYGNLVSSSSGSRTLANSGTIGIAGSFNPGTNSYTITSSTINYNGSSIQTITAFNYNNLTISGGRIGSPTITLASGIIGIANTATIAAGIYNATGNTFNYNGGTQTVDPDITYNNLTLSGTATKTTTGVTVNGILSIEGTTATLSSTPTFGVNATLQFNKTTTFAANTTVWPATFSGTGGVIVTSSANTILSNNNRTITYNLIIESGSVLNLGTSTGHTCGYLYLGGTLQTSTGTYGGTSSGATNINSTYFANNNGRISFSAKRWTGASSTSWTTNGNWSPNGAPNSSTIVTIPADAVSMPNVNGTSNCLDIILENGTTLSFASGQTLTVAGNFTNYGATLSGTGTIAFSGTNKTISGSSTSFPNININNGASITLSGSHSCIDFNILTTGSSTSFAHFNAAASIDISGNVNMNQPSSNSRNSRWLINEGLATVNGLITIGTNNTSTTTSRITEIVLTTGVLNANGGMLFTNVNNASRRIIMNGGAGTLNIANALTLNGQQTLTSGTAGSTVNFTGSSAQTISDFYSGQYHNLQISNTAGATLTEAITASNVTGNLLIQSGTLNNGGFAIVGNASKSLIVENGAKLILTGNSVFPTGFGTTLLNTGSTVEYAGTSAQTIATINYFNLTLSGARTTNNITLPNGGNLLISGTFSPTATFTSGNYITTNNTITFNGTSSQTIPAFVYNNLVSTSSGDRVLANAGTINVLGAFTPGTNSYTTTSSTINYSATTAQTVAAFNYNNLTVSGARGTNNLTFESGGSVGIKAIFTASASFSSGNYVVTNNTINYNATTGGQNVLNTFSYNNLTLSNTSGINTAIGNLVVNGTLTTTLGGTLNLSTNTLTGTLSSIVNNGTISTTNTSAAPIPASKTWGGTIEYSSSTAQTAVAGTYNNLTLNGNSIKTMGGNITANASLTFTNGKLSINGNTLTLGGNIVNTVSDGLIGSTTSNLIVNNAVARTLSFDQTTPGTTNVLNNFTNNSGAQATTLGNTLNIITEVTPTTGTIASGGNLVLVSNASGTARIAQGSGSYITGNVVAQRYIPSNGRRWRFMASPITNATINDWRNEIYVTGPGTGNTIGTTNSNGFDATQNNSPTIYWYNEALITGDLNTGWTSPTNVTNTITPGRGYRVFVRGDRSDLNRILDANATQNAVTLDVVGPINNGDISMPVSFTSSGTLANDGWNLLGNPYPSAFDWNAFNDAGRSGNNGTYYTGLEPTIYVLDPTDNSYKFYNALSNTGSITGGIIASGQAFWVKATASSPTMTFKEAYKSASTPTQLFKTTEGGAFKLRVIKDSANADEVFVKYLAGATTLLDDYDVIKLGSQISISAYGTDNKYLALTTRPLTTQNDTIRLYLNVASSGNYNMTFSNSEEIAILDQVWLIDNYTNSIIDLKNTPNYIININTTIPTSFQNRFYIVVANNNPVPVKLISFAGKKVSNNQVALNWGTANEKNSDRFEIEHATDGKTFTTIGSVKANRNSSVQLNYSFNHNDVSRLNYYRLKAINTNSTFEYSNTIMVNFDATNEEKIDVVKMYPIPAKNNVTIELSNQLNITQIMVFSLDGLLLQTLNPNSNKANIDLSQFAAGVYILQINDELSNVLKRKLIKQ